MVLLELSVLVTRDSRCVSYYFHAAQSSADNAKEVGAMAEGMAKKAWHFAQSTAGSSSSSATPSKGRRSYSTATSPSVTPGIVYTH